MKIKYFIVIFLLTIFCVSAFSVRSLFAQIISNNKINQVEIDNIQCGLQRTELYFPALKGKSVGIICNQGSLLGKVHLVDSLYRAGFKIKAIFSPEHGFRGEAEAGAEISSGTDSRTGTRIISIYGKNKKPLPADLAGIDILLFDLQDVGVRFYTYISTLSLVMEAASEQDIPLMVLDRPNPNGFYIDGPVLDTAFRSFVGMHPVPVVYGMTIGEYALMVNGESWLPGIKCDLTVIPMEGYQRNMLVMLNIKPSPNLPDWKSVYLYPSLCLFEGTMISVGRGTGHPFQVIGHPAYLIGSYIFKPASIKGVAENPPYKDRECTGANLAGYAENFEKNQQPFNLSWLIQMHDYFKDSTDFFNPYFDKLAGSDRLRIDIQNNKPEPEIRKSWDADLQRFRLIRSKYLLYPD